MELLIVVLVSVVVALALDAIVWRFGKDSRPAIENDRGQQCSHRTI